MPDPADNPLLYLLEEALRLAPEKQSSFIKQACEGDPGLLERARSALEAERRHLEARLSDTHVSSELGGMFDSAERAIDARADLQPGVVAALETLSELRAAGPRSTRLQVSEPLGTGSNASVSRALEPALRRNVALKRILPERASLQATARFLQEAQVLAQLDHPNVPPIYELGVGEHELPYYTTEVLRGRDFGSTFDGALVGAALRRAVSIIRQCASAAAYAHDRGIAHRDISPSNVVLKTREHAFLTDWGLAKVFRPSSAGRSDCRA